MHLEQCPGPSWTRLYRLGELTLLIAKLCPREPGSFGVTATSMVETFWSDPINDPCLSTREVFATCIGHPTWPASSWTCLSQVLIRANRVTNGNTWQLGLRSQEH